MKKLIIILAFLLPLAGVAGNGSKDEKLDIHISTNKNGKIVVSGLKGKELKKLENDINAALKDVTINVTDGKEKHTIHFKAEINIE